MNIITSALMRAFLFLNRYRRWAPWAAIAGVLLITLDRATITNLYTNIVTLVVFELTAIALSEFALYAYTEIRFTGGDDDEHYTANLRAASFVYLGTHIFLGLVLYSVYYLNVLQSATGGTP